MCRSTPEIRVCIQDGTAGKAGILHYRPQRRWDRTLRFHFLASWLGRSGDSKFR